MIFIIDSNKSKRRRRPKNVKWLKGDERVLAHIGGVSQILDLQKRDDLWINVTALKTGIPCHTRS
jgi:hypothetical protein